MVKKTPKASTSGESVANALDRWDEDGGAAATLWPLPYETSDLLDVQRRVLNASRAFSSECLPQPSANFSAPLPDTAQLKSRIARFLHDHKDAASDSR